MMSLPAIVSLQLVCNLHLVPAQRFDSQRLHVSFTVHSRGGGGKLMLKGAAVELML